MLAKAFAADATRRAEPQHTPYIPTKRGPKVTIRTEYDWHCYLARFFGYSKPRA